MEAQPGMMPSEMATRGARVYAERAQHGVRNHGHGEQSILTTRRAPLLVGTNTPESETAAAANSGRGMVTDDSASTYGLVVRPALTQWVAPASSPPMLPRGGGR